MRSRDLRGEGGEVDRAGALGLRVCSGDLLRVVGNEALDLVWGKRRVLLEHKRHSTGSNCRSLRGTAAAKVPGAESAFGVPGVDVAVGDAKALEVRADRCKIGVLASAATSR